MGISFGINFIEALVYGSVISTTDTVRTLAGVVGPRFRLLVQVARDMACDCMLAHATSESSPPVTLK